MKVVVTLCLLLAKETCTRMQPFKSVNNTGDQPGDPENQPLFLTPLIEAGRLDEAKSLSRVGPLGDVDDVPSYAGFLTVQSDMGSNMFFWFFPAKESLEIAPVILWLSGGPGSSSMYGLFTEHGPFFVDDDGNPKLRELTWTRSFSVLYVDNPVGTGYSFTEKDQGYANNQTDVGRDMHEALQQFFTLFHELADNEFYVCGDSFGGKFAVTVAYAIHTAVQPRVRIHLKGITIGDGLVEMESMLDYADYFYQIGLVDRNQAAIFRHLCDEVKHDIENERYADAVKKFDSILPCYRNTTCYFRKVTGFQSDFNFLHTVTSKSNENFVEFVQTPVVRGAIHVGSLPFHSASIVAFHLFEDLAKSVKPWLSTLMEEYKVLIYNGQLDIIIPYPLTANMISTISWSGAEEFNDAPRKIWWSPNQQNVSGYVRQVGNFTEILVRNAGHLVPQDQPEVALDMMTKFIRRQVFVPRSFDERTNHLPIMFTGE